MILGTILEGKPLRTSFGLEYQIQYDVNPDAKSMGGQVGSGLSNVLFQRGDRVTLEYRSTASYGLWFIIGKADVQKKKEDMKSIKDVVEQGGGIYVGMVGGLVLFNSPATGSTLALPEKQVTSEAVRFHIAESDAKFRRKD